VVDGWWRSTARELFLLVVPPERQVPVNLDGVLLRREAPNVDSERMVTSLRDSLRARNFERIAEDVALTYEGLTPADA
jgi:hypothetical protein